VSNLVKTTDIHSPKEKILIIRMLGLGDVACIGVPSVRHIKRKHPNAQIHFLTYAAGFEIMALAEPQVKTFGLKEGEWPEEIIHAMEVFIGLAQIIIGEAYTKIINLDTVFMPGFLSRFLKDAGEPVEGNYIGLPISDLIEQFQNQTLQATFVNDPSHYLQSTWFSMMRWHTTWWESEYLPERGYPEFYLRTCCGWQDINLDMQIQVSQNKQIAKKGKSKKVIALATEASKTEFSYQRADQLREALEAAGFEVWSKFDGSQSMRQTLAMLKSSDLLMSVPSAPQWLATSVGCPVMIISGNVDPRTLMPDYATDMSDQPAEVQSLVEGVQSIFDGSVDTGQANSF
jgi:ADP-heptose:LPS heptosyltransferase